jgi:hypothetical protein
LIAAVRRHQLRVVRGESVAVVPMVADAAAMFDAVKGMRIAPVGRSSLISILVPIALPLLVIATMQIPVGQLLLKLVNAVL